MTRVKRGVTQRRRHKAVLQATKGYRGQNRNLFRQAKRAWQKAGQHAYTDRKTKKRLFRSLWIVRLNAACRAEGMSYSRFINGLQTKMVALDRKVLADLAVNHPEAFKKLIELARS